ncbi:MAG: DsbA family protein [Desulfonatronovibrio sp.]|nr:DsbA family protein [Desulfovibrionales bacterium]
MKKVIIFLMAGLVFFPSMLMAGLQEEDLLDNVHKRFQTIVVERGGEPDSISRQDMTIEKKIPFDVKISGKDLTMFAVKISLTDASTGQKQNVNLIVDETGSVQLDGAFAELSTGLTLHQEALDELERIEGDPDVGDLLFKGSGDAQVLFLSDPFCPYCRQGYTYLLDQKDKIDQLKIAHFPINPDSGALALTFLMMEFKGQDNYSEVVDFAYMIDMKELSGNRNHQVISMFNQEFGVFEDEPEKVFADLEERHMDVLTEEMNKMQSLGLTGTPVFIVNGVMVSGFNKARIDQLLEK